MRAECLRATGRPSNAAATPATYTLSLHDALPISLRETATTGALNSGTHFDSGSSRRSLPSSTRIMAAAEVIGLDRKSTRLNSSHLGISYAVFCLKKQKHFLRHSRQRLPRRRFRRG